ncbi:hypothetical protein [Aromatoleum aromaticum]|uniref:hypothetical protein n=1 Tax=Aromatoleum aromaticum TaxID=551760 RepID=UPI00203E6D8F|nr:hypothetical protein [Aromatoleum aromaticum]
MSDRLSVPGELATAFRQFRQDFDQVTAQWIARGEESEASVAIAREGLRRYLADQADPDGRFDRLRDVFACWREIAGRVCGDGVAVPPVMSADAETRAADRDWNGRNG